MKISWKNILLWSLPALVIIFFVWQGFLGSNNTEFGKNIASSRMTYGRFLEYLEMGWVKQVDLYDNSRNAIIQASSPELGNRPQTVRVEIPVGASQLIQKLKELTNAREIRLVTTVDPTLIGGFLIKTDSKVIDFTVKNQLQQLAKHLDTVLEI